MFQNDFFQLCCNALIIVDGSVKLPSKFMSYFTRGGKWLYKFNPETIKICAENEYAFGLVIDTLVCTDILLKYMLTLISTIV